MQDVYRALEACQDKGLTKAIGVSNFNVQLLNDVLLYAKNPPAVNQVERHPWLQQRELMRFCQHHGVAVTAYAPLGNPGLFKTSLLQDPELVAIANERGIDLEESFQRVLDKYEARDADRWEPVGGWPEEA